ncbi:bZIP_ATF6 domain-containing protein ATf6 [Choristoneura fumiferana]|uniref:bZIP_ATF6 domain-containing protein ATf6 n=1 Tax=Choristoneura fumiferana TaxID=7141 RepID=UPI003D15697A
MDVDTLLESKDFFYGDDFLDQLTKDYQWSSILDATNASPSEILADAAPFLVPPISPLQSTKSSSNESSNSDSSSDDDSKNSSNAIARDSTISPFDWITNYNDEPPNNLGLEDIEEFLQKCDPQNSIPPVELPNVRPHERSGPVRPVVAIENGVIKIEGIKMENADYDETPKKTQHVERNSIQVSKGNGSLMNTYNYFRVVNEHCFPSITKDQAMINQQIKLVVDQKKVPTLVMENKNNVVPDSASSRKIAISPLPQRATCQRKVSPPRNNIVLYPAVVNGSPNGSVVQQKMSTTDDYNLCSVDLSNLSEDEIKALKKQQRMIKNRESACQSRQKKKDYVLSLQHQLIAAHNEIATLRRENTQLKNQLAQVCPRMRKIPRLDGRVLIPKKNIAVLCAMVFMVSLNFNILGWSSKPLVGPGTTHGNTRHLLWSEDSKEVPEPAYKEVANKSSYNPNCQNTTLKPGDFVNINQNESIRIAGELKRWIGRGKTLNWTYDEPKKRPKYMTGDKINGGIFGSYRLFNKLNLDSNFDDFNARNVKNMRVKPRLPRMRRTKDMEFADTAVIDYETLYPKPIKPAEDFGYGDFGEWNALLEALHRRDDTFYVVGVGKGEHLLLPAVSHNVTRPPKMALILPARTGNESSMNDHVTLMQIDCSVVNTSLVKLKSEALPESLRMKNEQIKPAVYPSKPEPKPFYDKKTGKHSIDNNIASVLHNISNNISNYPTNYKKDSKVNHDLSKDDFFAQYLISKYEETKSDTKEMEDVV